MINENVRKEKAHRICRIIPNSIAEELGVEPGDFLCTVNNNEINDIFDYNFLMEDEYVEVLIRTADGEECLLEIEKDEHEDFGVEFDSYLMDEYQSCHNKCIFCFIDQMPPGMRETLYFKDDDSRLSFLQGNYVTLTNMSDDDVNRICRYRMEPINISVQTMNPILRCKMLNNRFAGDALKKLDIFKEAGIEMNGQIVLCKGINDKEELDFTLSKLKNYLPEMKSVSVVPVGLTKFREGLCKLEAFNKEDACELIDQITKWQNIFLEEFGTRFIFASDEWYLTAERSLPSEEFYEGFPQLENGVGMITSLRQEVMDAITKMKGTKYNPVKASSFCGTAIYPYIREFADMVSEVFPGIDINVIKIENDYFGRSITVTGLLTGRDIINTLTAVKSEQPDALGEILLVPSTTLRAGEEVFLDDFTLDDLSQAIGVPVRITDSGGDSLVESFIKAGDEEYDFIGNTDSNTVGKAGRFRRNAYEQTDSSDSRQT